MHLTCNQKAPTWISMAEDNWIAEYSREVLEAEQRNQALQNRFDNIEGLDAW